MLQSACRRNTHTFKQLTYKKKENPPRTPKPEKQTQNTQQHSKNNKKRVTIKTRNATNRTDDDRRAAKAKAEGGDQEDERRTSREKKQKKEPKQTPGPIANHPGPRSTMDLGPGVGMQGARGSITQSEQETLQKNPWPKQTADNHPQHTNPQKKQQNNIK